MRRQDFIQSKLDEVKFRVSFPGEVVTTQEYIDDYAIDFAEWCLKNGLFTQFKITQRANKELLEIYKKEKGL